MKLRPYQEETTNTLREGLRTHQAGLLVSPCGSGKGTQITHIVETALTKGKHVIFAVHGKALVHDMSERVSKLGIAHGVLVGGHRRERQHAVQVASIDTLHRMNFPPKADLIIADEAHMALSPTWRNTLNRYPSAKLIGMTATPIRLDGQGLGRQSGGLFDFMVLGPSEVDLIGMGYLVPSRVLAPPAPPGLKGVKKTGGDFNAKAMAAVCDKAKIIGDMVAHWKKHAAGKKTATFAIDQAHSKHIAEQFCQAGVPWAHVDADTPDDVRARIWKDLDEETGNLMGVSSVGCISVGWDHPIVSCLISARKTDSLGLWKQMLGRGSRPYKGKDHFLVLDHVGNTHDHFPYGQFEDRVEWTLDGKPKKGGTETAKSVTTCKRPARINGILKLPCYATFNTGPSQCPYCGLPIQKEVRTVEQVEGELVEVKQEIRQKNEKIIRALFDSLQEEAAAKNYKSNYASVRFKAQYGFWPPKEWKSKLGEVQ